MLKCLLSVCAELSCNLCIVLKPVVQYFIFCCKEARTKKEKLTDLTEWPIMITSLPSSLNLLGLTGKEYMMFIYYIYI